MLAFTSMILPGQALEERQFYSPNKEKSFYGLLTGYDTSKKTVTVRLKNGQEKRFKIDLLAKDDQKYVLDNEDTLAVIGGVSLSFREIKQPSTRTKVGLIRTSSVPTSFDITVYNRSKTPIEDLELRYSYYYCVGTLAAGGPKHTPQVAKGTLMFDKIFGQDTSSQQTSVVDIVRASKKGVAPPVSSGGGGGGWCSIDDGDVIIPDLFDGRRKEIMLCAVGVSPGARRIDHVIGIAVDVVMDGKIVKSVANRPSVMKIHEEKRITTEADAGSQF